MSDQDRVYQLAQTLGQLLNARHWRVATAESCTGGGVAAAITAVAGSSNWFEYGLVTYANQAKQHLLGVDPHVLEEHGAVSKPVVQQMVTGALNISGAQIAVAISGVAGPGGGSVEKPVGSVWFAWGSLDGWCEAKLLHLTGDRQQIQRQAVIVALEGLIARLGTSGKSTTV
ncbi:CinA family protein [Cellvibrio japonicus]|uniref:Competence/damage-inducible protein CinA C-terminal domain subfamily n=1 Tax=Cellvibrio japonicus (strain Ueda107) TaxID=498211 RepID=B3PJB9_CELJU|nr:CinA family protein [Cellvibrio japonicus]ACE85410.1 competence/damage-inducible protein CinA C-terminal domain subfamily [Cellvibrio japonicus Ueda107]QEI12667.1 CinA family protein [Cellvibrio japonicus]QEI16241.1 CinA family protein [Cellvibrio japonicus]QEI19819.1 CinA family protein [Cellvibrio japonicus]